MLSRIADFDKLQRAAYDAGGCLIKAVPVDAKCFPHWLLTSVLDPRPLQAPGLFLALGFKKHLWAQDRSLLASSRKGS